MLETSMAREGTFNMRLSDEEAARLKFLTAHYGINAAAVFRMLLKKEADALLQGRTLRTPAICTFGGRPAQSHVVRYFDANETAVRNAGNVTVITRGGVEPPSPDLLAMNRMDQSGGSLDVVGAPGGWYLTTLLRRTWREGDTLALDAGQDWQIVNPSALLAEVRGIIGDDRFLAIEQLAKKLRADDGFGVPAPTKKTKKTAKK